MERTLGPRPWLVSLLTDRCALAVAATMAAAGILGWIATSPAASMGINWDTAGGCADLGRGAKWGGLPWNSHFAVGALYTAAWHSARLVGLTGLDGIRLLNAMALAGSAGAIVLAGLAVGLRPLLASLVAATYLASWGTLILVFTWEDNVLTHPPALMALAWVLWKIERWRPRDGFYCGLLVGLSSLASWQGASYAFPVMYVTLLVARPDCPYRQRLRDMLLVPVGLGLARLVWASLYWLTAHQLSYLLLLRTAFERPVPNFLPSNLAEWVDLARHWKEILIHAGIGVTHELGPGFRDSAALYPWCSLLGAGLLLLALVVWTLAWARRDRSAHRHAHFLAAAFLLLTLSAAVYLDPPIDKYKRYDYIPMFVSLGLALGVRWCLARWRAAFGGLLASLFLCALVLGQAMLGLHWNRAWYTALPTTRPVNYAGVGAQTWFAYLRGIRVRSPNACSFVFAFDELANARFQLEIPAALSSELTRPLVIGAPPIVKAWPRPLPLADAARLRRDLRGCEWLSPGAAAMLGLAHR